MIETLLPSAALFLSAMAIGVIVFFGAGTAPVIFKVLGEEKAGPVVRGIFPNYYLILAVLSGLAALCAFTQDTAVGLVLALVAGAFVFTRQFVMPKINALRDESLTGSISAKTAFDRLHSWIVKMNVIQLICLIGAFWVLALKPVFAPN